MKQIKISKNYQGSRYEGFGEGAGHNFYSIFFRLSSAFLNV